MLSASPNGDKIQDGEPLANFENAFGRLKWLLARAIPHAYKMLFVCLLSHADIKTGQCFPSIATLAAEGGLSRPTVKRAIKWLEAHNYLTIQQRFTTNGDRATSLYTLLMPGETLADAQEHGWAGRVRETHRIHHENTSREYLKEYLRERIRRMRHIYLLQMAPASVATGLSPMIGQWGS